jgi:hypothetical protein
MSLCHRCLLQSPRGTSWAHYCFKKFGYKWCMWYFRNNHCMNLFADDTKIYKVIDNWQSCKGGLLSILGFIVHWNNYSEWLEKLHAVVGLEMRWLKRSNSIIQHIAWFHLTLTVYHCSFCPLHVLVVINLNLLNL